MKTHGNWSKTQTLAHTQAHKTLARLRTALLLSFRAQRCLLLVVISDIMSLNARPRAGGVSGRTPRRRIFPRKEVVKQIN